MWPVCLTKLQSWLLVFKFSFQLGLVTDLEHLPCKSCQYFPCRFAFSHCLSVAGCFLCHQNGTPCHCFCPDPEPKNCLKIPSVTLPCPSDGNHIGWFSWSFLFGLIALSWRLCLLGEFSSSYHASYTPTWTSASKILEYFMAKIILLVINANWTIVFKIDRKKGRNSRCAFSKILRTMHLSNQYKYCCLLMNWHF